MPSGTHFRDVDGMGTTLSVGTYGADSVFVDIDTSNDGAVIVLSIVDITTLITTLQALINREN